MTWDIQQGRETAYLDFVTSEFAPALIRLGIELVEGWYTVYGDGPQILMGAVAEDVETVQKALASPEWQELKERLLEYVTNFSYKVVPATGRFQL